MSNEECRTDSALTTHCGQMTSPVSANPKLLTVIILRPIVAFYARKAPVSGRLTFTWREGSIGMFAIRCMLAC